MTTASIGSMDDLTVASTGDAMSLEGGMLLQTPLMGMDGEIHCLGQGPIVVGGFTVVSGGNSTRKAVPTRGTVIRRAWEEGLIDAKRSTLMGMRGGLYAPDDLGDPVGPAGVLSGGLAPCAKRPHGGDQLGPLGRHHQVIETGRLPGGLPGVLDQGLTGLGQQQFAGQPCRGLPGRYHPHHVPSCRHVRPFHWPGRWASCRNPNHLRCAVAD